MAAQICIYCNVCSVLLLCDCEISQIFLTSYTNGLIIFCYKYKLELLTDN